MQNFYKLQEELEKENKNETVSNMHTSRKNTEDIQKMILGSLKEFPENELFLLDHIGPLDIDIDNIKIEGDEIKGDFLSHEEKIEMPKFTSSLHKENKKEEKKVQNTNLDQLIKENPQYKNLLDSIVKLDEEIKVVGLDDVKKTLQEIIVWPLQHPEIFKGLRGPPKGLLLFGPPGTGKTLLGKYIASKINATFFSISASALLSKFIGEAEKMVRGLFQIAKTITTDNNNKASVIFIDEIDSLLMNRSENEHESSRRIKTEFLVQLDGIFNEKNSNQILFIGATNRPQEIDEAARRRFVKRVYIPLPDICARVELVSTLLSEYENDLTENDLSEIGKRTEGYSCSDIYNLCREASMEPVREALSSLNDKKNIRKIIISDFVKATNQIKKSVNENDLKTYEIWNEKFGSV